MNRRESLALAGAAPTDEQWEAIVRRRPPAAGTMARPTDQHRIVCRPGCRRTPGAERFGSWPAWRGARGGGPAVPAVPPGAHGGRRGPGPRVRGGGGDGDRRPSLQRLEAGDEPPSDVELARTAGLSERRLREAFRAALGVTPRSWVPARRAERLRAHLDGRASVLGAIYEAGYGSASTAYEAAAAELGMPPGRYRDGGAGETIRWTAARYPRAWRWSRPRTAACVRSGSGRDGAPSSPWRPSCEPSTREPRSPRRLRPGGDGRHGRRSGGRPPASEASGLPLDVHATAFRRRVWEALRRIPWGETRSYGQVAEAVGAPRAAAR